MGCKAKELYPFRGGWASAYAISKAYGLQHRTHLVQKRLRMGIPAEEAVQVRRDQPKKVLEGGITPCQVERLREEILLGQTLRVPVLAASMGRESTVERVETCRVVEKHSHFVILKRPCGLRISRTYVDLLTLK